MSDYSYSSQSQVQLLPPDQLIGGESQADLGDQWWQTVLRIPQSKHFGMFDDQTDPAGRRGSVEKAFQTQSGAPVFFIGGAFGEILNNVGGVLTLERTIVLLNNGEATIFFPILNLEDDNLTTSLFDSETGEALRNLTIEELREEVGNYVNLTEEGGNVSKLFASIDNRAVQNPEQYRQASEAPFSYTIPYPVENSIHGTWGYDNESYLDNRDNDLSDNPAPVQLQDLAGSTNEVTIGPVVADGYWLAVDVAGGDHTLQFGGTFNSEGEPFFQLDITYNILNPIYGTDKRERLYGTNENDYIDGRKGDDRLSGLVGDDLIVGGQGNDVIDGGSGDDELWGDEGYDTFVFRRGYGQDMIYDFSKEDKIDIGERRISHGCISPVDLPNGLSAVEIQFGGDDVLTLVNIRKNQLRIGDGFITLK